MIRIIPNHSRSVFCSSKQRVPLAIFPENPVGIFGKSHHFPVMNGIFVRPSCADARAVHGQILSLRFADGFWHFPNGKVTTTGESIGNAFYFLGIPEANPSQYFDILVSMVNCTNQPKYFFGGCIYEGTSRYNHGYHLPCLLGYDMYLELWFNIHLQQHFQVRMGWDEWKCIVLTQCDNVRTLTMFRKQKEQCPNPTKSLHFCLVATQV